MNRTDRLVAILLELQARGGLRAEDLADQFEVSVRTIYRDLDALGEGGVPLVALALVEAQVGSLLDVLPVAVLIADGAGKVIRANEAAAELLEQPVLVGRSVQDVLRAQRLDVRQRCLVQGDEVLHLYVIHSR
jgi:predicted DNA-binding transcriptional regulator YafY